MRMLDGSGAEGIVERVFEQTMRLRVRWFHWGLATSAPSSSTSWMDVEIYNGATCCYERVTT